MEDLMMMWDSLQFETDVSNLMKFWFLHTCGGEKEELVIFFNMKVFEIKSLIFCWLILEKFVMLYVETK